MEKNTWLTDKGLMERCKINAPTLAQHILDKKIKAHWTEIPPWKIYPPAPRDLKGNVQNAPGRWTWLPSPPTKDRIPFPDGSRSLGNIMQFLDKAIFALEDVIAFEAKHVRKAEAGGEGKSEKKLRHSQKCKKECRKVAAKLWEEDPDKTAVDMINHSEIVKHSQRPDGSYYLEKTVRGWIGDLNPNREPGRRPKKN
jgi:hypothetical protein